MCRYLELELGVAGDFESVVNQIQRGGLRGSLHPIERVGVAGIFSWAALWQAPASVTARARVATMKDLIINQNLITRSTTLNSLNRLSVRARVVKFDFTTSSVFRRVNDAGVKWPGIHMETDSTLIKFARVVDAVHRILRIDRARVGRVHLDRVAGFEATSAVPQILRNQVIVTHQETSNGNSHPAVLITMVVDGAALSYFPANSEQFIQWRFVDEIPGVVLGIPRQVTIERLWSHRSVLQKFQNPLSGMKSRRGKFSQRGYELFKGNRPSAGVRKHLIPSITWGARSGAKGAGLTQRARTGMSAPHSSS